MPSLLSHPELSDCRRLFLRNYNIMSNIGVHDFEKVSEQRVLFNVELFIPLLNSTPTQDELDEVVDYDFIRETIKTRVGKGHVQLQETLCDEIAHLLLKHPKVRGCSRLNRKARRLSRLRVCRRRSLSHQREMK
jgi:7,8-dihydroneopterin aldolase/epimerase/oxygenase